MNRRLSLVLALGLIAGLAGVSQAQVVVSIGGRAPGRVLGQPYGYGYGYNNAYSAYAPGYRATSYGVSTPFGYRSYSATSYTQAYAAPGYSQFSFGPSYVAPPAAYYSRGYTGVGLAPTAGAYLPYGGYAAPNVNYGYGFANPGNYPNNTGMNFYGYGITGP